MSFFIKFPSIGQFRNVVKQVRSSSEFTGIVNGAAEYNSSLSKPILKFTGTVKVHGTNASVCYDHDTGEMWVQSRNNVITIERDNAGFAFWVSHHKEYIKEYMKSLGSTGVSAIFGEWCGGNIQKGVGIQGLEKMFICFSRWHSDSKLYLSTDSLPSSGLIINILQFPTYEATIDFNNPEMAINNMVSITLGVEQECPVADRFGVKGIGEGVVWYHYDEPEVIRFKVKGDKHSSSRVKKLISVDTEKLETINKVVDYCATEVRFKQAIEQVFTTESKEVDIKNMGAFIRWVMSDIIKEESDTLFDNRVEPKDIGKHVSNKARQWFKTTYL